ncbi:site-specific integrase [Pseudomonas viridiflava]|uniref:site-specific integrase n=1 Tax=Pseudomonas viridiflava TaxID=33069 RepID=UPI000F059487|nr:site-specific integrase [Pseudomonas viridiflava]
MITVLDLTNEYVGAHNLRPDSVKIYHAATRSFIRHFGNCQANDVDTRQILVWRKERLDGGLAKRSWNTYSSHLRTVFGFGIQHDLLNLKKNPFSKTSVIPPKKPKKTVVSDAISRARSWLLTLVDEEQKTTRRAKVTPAWFWLTVFEMFYHTGVRLNALLCIQVADVNLKTRLIRIQGDLEKTHREFMIPIPDDLMPFIMTLIESAQALRFGKTDQLFNVNRFSVFYRRKYMNLDQVEAMYKKLTKETGVRMTPHRFRHTIASDLMKQPQRNIHVTKTLLNHSNMATTMEYIEPDYDFMRIVLNERSRPPTQLTHRARVDLGAVLHRLSDHTTALIESAQERPIVQKIDPTLSTDTTTMYVIDSPKPASPAAPRVVDDQIEDALVIRAEKIYQAETYLQQEAISSEELDSLLSHLADWLKQRRGHPSAAPALTNDRKITDQLNELAQLSNQPMSWNNR